MTPAEQIDQVLFEGKKLKQRKEDPPYSQITTLYSAAIERYAPPNSQYVKELARQKESPAYTSDLVENIEGVLRALHNDYREGRMAKAWELVHANLFSDFLEMAEYLLDEGYKDAAAVLAGGVLEEHLRKLCAKQQPPIDTTSTDAKGKTRPKKLDTMNTDLAKASAYDANEHKQVTAWAAIRNDAAHGNYTNYNADQVATMLQWIRGFISRYPA